jgi:hypothetical protein
LLAAHLRALCSSLPASNRNRGRVELDRSDDKPGQMRRHRTRCSRRADACVRASTCYRRIDKAARAKSPSPSQAQQRQRWMDPRQRRIDRHHRLPPCRQRQHACTYYDPNQNRRCRTCRNSNLTARGARPATGGRSDPVHTPLPARGSCATGLSTQRMGRFSWQFF